MDTSKVVELSELAQAINEQTDLGIHAHTDGSYTWTHNCIETGHFNSEQDAIIDFIKLSIATMKEYGDDAEYDDESDDVSDDYDLLYGLE